jgi:DNA-binding GntR family transcriptional regulator
MSDSKLSAKVAYAADYIRTGISNGNFEEGEFLPPVARIARDAGVSIVTMWKAVSALKDEGILQGKHGERTRIATSQATVRFYNESRPDTGASATGETALMWQKVKRALKHDVFKATFGSAGILPTIKELQARFGTAYPTIKKALHSLCTEQVIEPYRRGYRRCTVKQRRRFSRVVALIRTYQSGSIPIWDFDEMILRGFETECAHAGMTISIITYTEKDDSLLFSDIRTGRPCTIDEDDGLAGYILFVQTRYSLTENMLQYLSRRKRPVAILDEIDGWQLPRMLARNPLVQVFSAVAMPKAARKVAHHLLDLGHRSIAYISPFHGSRWSRQRLEALTAAYDNAGYRKAVHPFTIDDSSSILDYREKAARHANVQELMTFYRSWKEKAPPDFQSQLDPGLQIGITMASCRAELYAGMTDLLRKALSQPGITAWVAANDQAAQIIQKFLNIKRISTPDGLSYISFDDTLDSLKMRITSYNPNLAALATLIFNFLLYPRTTVLPQKNRKIIVEGAIIDRGTTGQVSGRS